MSTPFGFCYRADLLATFPEVVGGILYVTGLQGGPTPPDLAAAYADEQTAARARGYTPTEMPPLAAWRAAFRRFGVKPTKYRSAAEALLRRLDKQGDIPSINNLVDIGNLVSIRYALPVAIVDTRQLAAPSPFTPPTGANALSNWTTKPWSTPNPAKSSLPMRPASSWRGAGAGGRAWKARPAPTRRPRWSRSRGITPRRMKTSPRPSPT